MNRFSPLHFSLFRFCVGIAGFFHFITLSPLAPELTPTNSILVPFYTLYLPNPLSLLTSSSQVQAFIGGTSVLAVLLALGFQRRIIAGILLVAWMSTVNGVPLLPTIRDGLLPFSLLILALIPDGESLSLWPVADANWECPQWLSRWFPLLLSTAVVMGTGQHFFSGIPALPADYAIGLLFLCGALLYANKESRALGWLIIFCLAITLPQQRFLPLLLAYLGALILALGQGLRFSIARERSLDRIVFVDGSCVLCHGLAQFLLREDVAKRLRLATLQGETASRELPKSVAESLHSVVLLDGRRVYDQSSAVLRIFILLGGFWTLAALGFLVPSTMRNFLYRSIADRRYRLFGRLDSCRLPQAKDRDRLLD